MRINRIFICLIAIILTGSLPATVHSVSNSQITLSTGFTSARDYQGLGAWSINPGEVKLDLSGNWGVKTESGKELNPVDIPFSWDDWDGRIILQRQFFIPDSLSSNCVSLVVDGFSQFIAITLNGMNLDTRRGDGMSFQLDLEKNLLRFGNIPNNISIELDNRLAHRRSVPLKGGLNARRRFGGIFGGIYLICAPDLSILDLQAKLGDPQPDSTATTIIESTVRNRDRSQTVRIDESAISLHDRDGLPLVELKGGGFDIPAGGLKRKQFTLNDIPLKLWKPVEFNESYPVTFRVSGAGDTVKCNIKYNPALIELNGSGIVVNNQVLRIRCVSYFEEYPKSGTPLTDEQIETDISLVKALGANAIRTVQGCASLRLLEVCEREGILVFEELPVFQAPDPVLVEEEFIRAASEQLRALIERDRRFTCIAGWGIGSQINSPNSENRSYYQQLIDLAHSLDKRPVYATIPLDRSQRIAPLDFAILEISPISKFSGSAKLPERIDRDRPVLVGGIERAIIPGRLGGYADPASEGGQADFIVGKVIQAEKIDWNFGVVVGSLNDWRGSTPSVSGPLHGQSNLYTTGLTDEYRRPRLAYHRLQEYWTTGMLQPLPRGKKSGSESGILIVIGLGLITALLVAMKQNKLFRQNIARTFTSPRGFFQDIGENRYFQTGHTVLLTFLVSGSFALIGSGWLNAYRYNYALDWAVSYIIGDIDAISWAASLIWSPLKGFVFFWGLAFILIWLSAFRIMLTCKFMGKRCSLSQGINFLTWSSAVFIFLLPVGTVAERLFAGSLDWVVFTLLIGMAVWSVLRLLAIISQQVRRSVMAVVALYNSGPLIATILILWFLESTRQLSLYWGFFWSTILK